MLSVTANCGRLGEHRHRQRVVLFGFAPAAGKRFHNTGGEVQPPDLRVIRHRDIQIITIAVISYGELSGVSSALPPVWRRGFALLTVSSSRFHQLSATTFRIVWFPASITKMSSTSAIPQGSRNWLWKNRHCETGLPLPITVLYRCAN